MKLRSLFLCLTAVSLAPATACVKKQNAAGNRDSGQSRLMDKTFAGQNACNPDDHDRPFIVEWDATDMSSFESLAANDIVFVKYEGCNLKVLDECKNDSIKGEQGAYKPPEWTSGQLEVIDISNSAELTAKLPLAQATLGGRVSGGEKFHMEYFVAGTRMASRDAVYESDLDGRYGCDQATHFVYGYNLGAFALASAENLEVEAGGSAFGFGATGKTDSSRSAEKKGGDLKACKSDSATEVLECKAPIRLRLRKIRPGDSPEKTAMAGPETPEDISAAAIINTKIEMSEEAQAHANAAMEKFQAGDGKGCLAELNQYDRLNPKDKSENPKSSRGALRGMCLMKAGKCDAGKKQLRMAYEKTMQQWGEDVIDRTVESNAAMYCEGKMSNRDALLKAWQELQMGGSSKTLKPKECRDAYNIVKKLSKKVEPKDGEDYQVTSITHGDNMAVAAARCFGRAGDCKTAFQITKTDRPKEAYEGLEKIPDEEMRKKTYMQIFEGWVPKCKGKL
jgi:hypothetical protein